MRRVKVYRTSSNSTTVNQGTKSELSCEKQCRPSSIAVFCCYLRFSTVWNTMLEHWLIQVVFKYQEKLANEYNTAGWHSMDRYENDRYFKWEK